MKRDDIIRMAREAGMEVHERKGQVRIGSAVLTGCDSTEQVERFASLVAAAERSACLHECEEQASKSMISAGRATKIRDKESYQSAAVGAKFCVARIRARGQA